MYAKTKLLIFIQTFCLVISLRLRGDDIADRNKGLMLITKFLSKHHGPVIPAEEDLSRLPHNVQYFSKKKKNKHSVVKVLSLQLPGEKLANLVPKVLLENSVDERILHLVRDPRRNVNW